MKNIIIIDLDTTRNKPIHISKPNGFVEPTTPEGIKDMVLGDISTLCEALCLLIKVADNEKVSEKKDLVETSVKYLQSLLVEPTDSNT
jgi:hypothetical protein